MVRGGSWNNNQLSARASVRNDNHPDNRNNNIGFRVVCVSHIKRDFWARDTCRPEMPGDHGCRAEGKTLDGAGSSCPHEARRHPRNVGRIRRDGRLPGPMGPKASTFPRRLMNYSPFGLLQPAAEQPSDFRHHRADVLVLAGAEPLPGVCEPQVQPQPSERGVGRPQC